MSDGANQSQPPARGPSSTTNPRVSSTTNPRVMTAARTAPLPKEQQEAIGQRLKSGSTNVALNTVAILKEMVRDFRQQDRFFKYKAFIVGGWLALSLLTLSTTCARGVKETGEFGASLLPPVAGRNSVTIKNNSDEPWLEITVVVRDDQGAEWRASVGRLEPTHALTITPKQLLGTGGRPAPGDIRMRDIEMRTSEGTALLRQNHQDLTKDAP